MQHPLHVSTVGTGTQTCNGNGDGLLQEAAAGSNEVFRFWQHLANAGLIEGTYRGTTDGSSTASATTNNVPRGKLGNSLWFAYNWGTISSNGFIFDGIYNNSFAFGMAQANTWPATVIFKPEEAWNIDTKMDDGKPATGRLVAFAYPACTNAAVGSTLTADYALSTATITCGVVFPRAF